VEVFAWNFSNRHRRQRDTPAGQVMTLYNKNYDERRIFSAAFTEACVIYVPGRAGSAL
jgi:hypothetical protein